jgi:hypothetical protein
MNFFSPLLHTLVSQHDICSLVEQEHWEHPEFSVDTVSKKIAKKLDIIG